jgi:hypothetical protein
MTSSTASSHEEVIGDPKHKCLANRREDKYSTVIYAISGIGLSRNLINRQTDEEF